MVRLMTPSLITRPVLASLVALTLAGCGGVESDPNRFENLAKTIAAIPLDGRSPDTAAGHGLRPALNEPVRVEVMEPHALWDARDGMLTAAVQETAPRMIEAAAPVVAKAVVDQAAERAAEMTRAVDLRPALPRREPKPVQPAPAGRALVQLGAYSTEAGARAAWSRLKDGQAAWALEGLSPVFEPVQVGERRLVRLKVPAPAAGAAAVCAAAGIDDPWCRRTA